MAQLRFGQKKQPGFTLIELLVTVAVVGVLAAIATPSFTTLIKNNRLATETNDLMSDPALARAEAARRGTRVSLCASTDGATCASGAAWQGGRIVFIDGITYGEVSSGDEIMRVTQSAAAKKITITASGFVVGATSTLNYLLFRPNGAVGSDAAGVFKICDDRTGAFGREIEIMPIGRASLKTTTASCP